MPRKRIPSYRLHKPTSQAIVVIEGHTHYLGKHGSPASREKYDQMINRLVARRKDEEQKREISQQNAPYSWTVDQLAIAYREYAINYYKKNGQTTAEFDCIKVAMRYLTREYGTTLAAEFGPRKLRELRETLIAGKYAKPQRKMTRKFVNSSISRITRAFKWAVSHELVPERVIWGLSSVEPLKKGRSLARETEPIGPVAEHHIDLTLTSTRPEIGDMICLQLLTGMRPGELCQMRPADIDRSEDIWIYTPASHKMEHQDRRRMIAIGPQGKQILSRYLFGDHCFVNSRGNAYTRESYALAIRRACKRVRVPHWAPNQLRHNRATEIRKRFDILAAQTALGHASPNTTELYAQRDLASAIKVAAAMG